MRTKILMIILFALFIFTACEQETVTVDTPDITSETSQETTVMTEIAETSAFPVTMPEDIIPQTADIITILSGGYDALYDACAYVRLDLTNLDPSVIYADGNFYMDNLLIGSIDPTMPAGDISDILPDGIPNADAIEFFTFELPKMRQPKESDYVYEAYTIDAEEYYIRVPLINDDSPEIREFNIKLRDDFFHNAIENYDTLLVGKCVFYYNSQIVGDCIGITIDQTKYYNPYSFEYSHLNPFEFSVQYYYNLKEHRYIDFDEFLWHGLLLQLNSDEFYDTYFADHIDRDYVITREADHVEIVKPPEIEYGEYEAVPVQMYQEFISMTLNLKNTIPLEISVRRHQSSFNKELILITTDIPFDPKNYPVAEIGDEIINTAYSHTFTTKYDEMVSGTYYNNFNIPQINSDNPEAVRLNQTIIDYLFTERVNMIWKLIEMNRGDCLQTVVYTKDYDYLINDGILCITLYNFGGLLGSESDTSYKFIYYDYVNDRELTCEEYLIRNGYTMNQIVDIINGMKDINDGYYYDENKVFTKNDIIGVEFRDDGAMEFYLQSEYNEFIMTTPYYEESGTKFFSYKRGLQVPNFQTDLRGSYYMLEIENAARENDYHGIYSDIPYDIYFTDTQSAAVGVTATTVELSVSPNYEVVINIRDILRHHSADPDTKYEKVTAKITGVTGDKLAVLYTVDSISGTIYFDLNKSEAYFDGNETTPLYKRYAADLLNGSDIFLPQKMLTVSIDTPYNLINAYYTYENNVERLYIGDEYDPQIFTLYNFIDTENKTAESMLAELDCKIYSQEYYIDDNLMTGTLVWIYRDGANEWESIRGYGMVYIDGDTAFFITSDDYGRWNEAAEMWEVVSQYDDFIKFAESVKISRG